MTETPNPYILDADTMTGDMRPIRQAVLSLGSNLGERFRTLQGAVHTFADTPDVTVVAVSPVYETEPVDAPDGSPPYLNAVVLADTTLPLHTVLDRCRAVEAAFGRERQTPPNAPRTLDVDLIVLGERVADDPDVVVPHPRAHERAFVLRPWLDVDPQAAIPGRGAARDLLARVDQSGIKRRDDLTLVV